MTTNTRAGLAVVMVLAIIVGALLATPSVAEADTQPSEDGVPQTVSADPLPTPQINGVVWTQAVVGDRVFVGGHFTTARPDGAAVGEDTVSRPYILAYDINTGELDESFAPVLDGQVMDLQVSPDGQTLYAGGSFKKVNGEWRVGLAAFDVATGQLKSGFRPVASTTVRAIAVSDDAVYFGGDFTLAGDAPGKPLVSRKYLAAADATTGTLLPEWDPQADSYIRAMTMNPDRSLVVIGGHYENISGEAWYGFSALDPVDASAQPWAAEAIIRDAGPKSSLTSLVADDDGVLATGYHFGPGGNFEGITRLDGNTGELTWLADCFGDHHSAFAQAGVVYGVSHAHNCANIEGSFDDFYPRIAVGSDAFTDFPTSTLYRDQQRGTKFEGMPAPKPVAWWPNWYFGTYTTSDQGPWNVTGNDDYIVVGGEFIGLSGRLQQGLTRFARPDNAPNLVKPQGEPALTPTVVSYEPGEVHLGWQETHDRDNATLTYKVYREYKSDNDKPIHEVTRDSNWYDRNQLSFTDTGLTPGATHSYVIVVFDPFGNRWSSGTVEVTVATESGSQAYGRMILQDKPSNYYRSVSGGSLVDLAGADNMTALSKVSSATSSPTSDTDATSIALASDANGTAAARIQEGEAPDTFSLESWVKTTDSDGGRIIGFGQRYDGTSGRADRHIYIDDEGAFSFGANQLNKVTIKSGTGYNDGSWHHVAASLSENGMRLYVDGELVAQDGSLTQGRRYAGSWRIGRDNMSYWSKVNSNGYLNGTLAEVAIYDRPLSGLEVAKHAEAGGIAVDRPVRPGDEFGAAVYDHDPDLYWRFSDEVGSATVEDTGLRNNDGTVGSGVTLGVEGGLHPSPGTAAHFDSSSTGVVGVRKFDSPLLYTTGAWIKTGSSAGGKIIGFGDSASGSSSEYDRHVYLRPDGTPAFGVSADGQEIVSGDTAINDDNWHFVVATQSSEGMRLYVDGALVGSNDVGEAGDYAGYWRVGAGSVWEGADTSFDGTVDEVFVLPRALTEAEVQTIRDLGTVPDVNLDPTASFSAAVTDLGVSFDAGDSNDADGSIVGYEWDFGDGEVGTGVTVGHEYADAGTYSVTLTVTDNKGSVGSTSKDVTVVRPNELPSAEFVSQVDGLKVSVDAAASQDPDGTIASYSWDFGDGTTGTGVTENHTYADAGTYTITLTVVDDRDGEAVSTADVTVAPPPPGVLADDTFSRDSSAGWGTADLGGAWSHCGGSCISKFSVTSRGGEIVGKPGSGPYSRLPGVDTLDSNIQTEVSLAGPVGGGSAYFALMARGDGSDGYHYRLRVSTTGDVYAQLRKRENGAMTSIASAQLPGVTHSEGNVYLMEAQTVGSSPTSLKFKAWVAGAEEPAGWLIDETDSAATLQGSGSVGLWTYLSASAPDPITYLLDRYTVREPGEVEVPNELPSAEFVSQVDGLKVSVDAAASQDPDGTIASYSWDFGDGTTGTGVTENHTYADAGTYTITLTVVDDRDGEAVSTADVTVAPPPPGVLADDTFSRDSSAGWGTADLGGAWSHCGGSCISKFSVTSRGGEIVGKPGSGPYSRLPGVDTLDSNIQTEVSLAGPVGGGSAYFALMARGDGSDGYHYRLRVSTTGDVYAQLRKRENGAMTSIASAQLPGVTHSEGNVYLMEAQTVGSSPTSLKFKAWVAGAEEPAGWLIDETDSAATLQGSGSVGLWTYLSASAPDPITYLLDRYTVREAA